MESIFVKPLLPRREIVEILRTRDGYFCFHPQCLKPFAETDEVTIDHWIPLAKGGTWDIKNLRLMHKRCNALKSDTVPNADGSLPELRRDLNAAARRMARREARAEVCNRCNSGRALGPEESCEVCGSMAMPPRHPQWAKMKPQDCSHDSIWWCWACMSGIIERGPAIHDVLRSDDDSEF